MRSRTASALIAAAMLLIVSLPTPAAARSTQRDTAIELRGTFVAVSGDPSPGSSLRPTVRYSLRTSNSSTTPLVIDPSVVDAGIGLLDANRRRVVVRGVQTATGALRVAVIGLDDTAASASDRSAPVPNYAGSVGRQRWLNVLCRFADSRSTTPQTAEWIEALFGTDEPGIGHYWNDVSYGQMELIGTRTVGWFNLPHPRSTYVITTDDGSFTYFDQFRATEDCTAAADRQVNFPAFDGINLMFNDELDGYAWGGSAYLSLDGQEREYGATWLPVWGYENQYVVAHEMGHAMGLFHSSGAYDATYDSEWDVMSQGGTCNPPSAEFGCIGVHPIAYHKDRLGWLPPARVATIVQPGSRTLTLDALSNGKDGSNYLMAKIPIQLSATQFYTLEARWQTGYDQRSPGDAVVIHRVDTTRWERSAQVVDPDVNFNPNDDSAKWVPGETFHDRNAGISVRVDARTATGFTVTITTSNAFVRTWDRTDRPVRELRTQRTWMWGPASFTGAIPEAYYDSPSAERTVIYYDKARMEITNPDGDASSIWFVTNGLLVVELMSGRLQLSDSYFESYAAASINVAGDPDDTASPTYATFGTVSQRSEPDREGAIRRVLRRDGTIQDGPGYVTYAIGTSAYAAETGHWIATPFWEFMQSSGTVYVDGTFITDALFGSPYYATGLPVSDAYWATVEVGGTPRDVLIQCFERRCLTYTPDNAPEWRVEAGNVGRHYYSWRYEQIVD